MIGPLAKVWAIVMATVAGAPGPPAAEYVPPATRTASFSPLPEMWGLRELAADAPLGDLDQSVALFLPERARFEGGAVQGWIYFAGGKQLIVEGELTEPGIADRLRSHACVCGLEYEAAGGAQDLLIAAGTYRVATAPSIETAASGITRVEFRFEQEGQSERVRIRRLVCWGSAGATLKPITRALPGFAKLTRKEHPGFVDPPVDDWPISNHELARQGTTLALGDEFVGRAYDESRPLRLDVPELVGTAKPGLLTLLREIRTGRKLHIDYSGYYEPLDTYLRDLNRRSGIYYRDPCYWP